MEPQLPTLEFWTVIKWVAILVFVFGLKEFAAVIVRKRFYGTEKHDRRSDTDKSRGWIERFLENQKDNTAATIEHAAAMKSILAALEKNGKIIEDFTKAYECKYESHRGRS